MAEITEATSIEELAAIISEALEEAGITATRSGGGAVSIYSHNQSMSHDLDFVTSADPKSLLKAMAPLGFVRGSKKRLNEQPRTKWLVEFPAGPIGFGDLTIPDPRPIESLQTVHGPFPSSSADTRQPRPDAGVPRFLRDGLLLSPLRTPPAGGVRVSRWDQGTRCRAAWGLLWPPWPPLLKAPFHSCPAGRRYAWVGEHLNNIYPPPHGSI